MALCKPHQIFRSLILYYPCSILYSCCKTRGRCLNRRQLSLLEYKKAAIKKFKHKEHVSVGGRYAEIVEIPPFFGNIPDSKVRFESSSTNVLLPGYGTSQETYQEAIIEAALRGGHIFALTQPREDSQTIFDDGYPKEGQSAS